MQFRRVGLEEQVIKSQLSCYLEQTTKMRLFHPEKYLENGDLHSYPILMSLYIPIPNLVLQNEISSRGKDSPIRNYISQGDDKLDCYCYNKSQQTYGHAFILKLQRAVVHVKEELHPKSMRNAPHSIFALFSSLRRQSK